MYTDKFNLNADKLNIYRHLYEHKQIHNLYASHNVNII